METVGSKHLFGAISLSLIIALVGLPQISETIYTPALPAIADGLQASIFAVEATLSIYFMGFAVGVAVWGAASDRIGRRMAMLIGLLIYSSVTLACSMVDSINTLLILRFFQAFGASVGSVITMTILRDLYSGVERSKVFAIMGGALAFSPAFGPFIGGFVSEMIGWRANFFILTLVGSIIFLWSLKALPETRPQLDSNNTVSFKKLLLHMMSSKPFWGHVVLVGGVNGILFGFYQEAPFVFIDQLGISPGIYGSIGLVIAVAAVISSRLTYTFSSMMSGERISRFGACLGLGGAIAFGLPIYLNLFEVYSAGFWFSILGLSIHFVGIGFLVPISLSLALKPFQYAVGRAGSIFGVLYYVITASCTWLICFLHNNTAIPLALYILALSILLLVGTMMIQLKKGPVGHPAIEPRSN